MRIGIDLDGVIFDSEKEFRIYSELYDVIELKGNNIIDNKTPKFQDRYNWSQDIITDFWNKHVERIIRESKLMPGAKEVLELLKAEGHSLIIISARGFENESIIKISEETLERNGILKLIDKSYYSVENKLDVCKSESIDLMIDDFYSICKQISNNKIRVLYIKDSPYDRPRNTKYLTVVNNFRRDL